MTLFSGFASRFVLWLRIRHERDTGWFGLCVPDIFLWPTTMFGIFLSRFSLWDQAFCDDPQELLRTGVSWHMYLISFWDLKQTCAHSMNSAFKLFHDDFNAQKNQLFKMCSRMNCGGHYVLADVTAPYVHNITGRCVHQGDPLLYSCSSCKDTVKRLCPCRQLLNSIDVQVHAAKPESWHRYLCVFLAIFDLILPSSAIKKVSC